MELTGRERVLAALDFDLDGRAPRDLWTLPWAELHHRDAVARLLRAYPRDMVTAPSSLRTPLRTRGEQHGVGTYVDEWGAEFENIQPGVIGEVRRAAVEAWDDPRRVRLPVERLSVDRDAVDGFCRSTDLFVLAPCVARPFERLQFLRRSEDLLVDLLEKPRGLEEFLRRMHGFYVQEMELWASTRVDGLFFMDDWGGQRGLLVSPDLWRRVFRPLYRDYVEIAHRAGKRAFMHSDGYILPIVADLVDLGLDAINCQIFCMGADALAAYRGRITFWGEIDRQYLLAAATVAEVETAVASVADRLWSRGGVIAQCEFGAGARPENVEAVFRAWDAWTGARGRSS